MSLRPRGTCLDSGTRGLAPPEAPVRMGPSRLRSAGEAGGGRSQSELQISQVCCKPGQVLGTAARILSRDLLPGFCPHCPPRTLDRPPWPVPSIGRNPSQTWGLSCLPAGTLFISHPPVYVLSRFPRAGGGHWLGCRSMQSPAWDYGLIYRRKGDRFQFQ